MKKHARGEIESILYESWYRCKTKAVKAFIYLFLLLDLR